MLAVRAVLIMVSPLQELDPVVEYFINEPIRFRNPAGPHISPHMPQVLRLADS